MAIVKGPFQVKFGDAVLAGIDTLDFSYDVDSNDYDTVQGFSYTLYGAHRVSVTATFLESDVPALAAVLPQYYVANGGTLSTGETVSNADGAIDLVPGDLTGAETTDVVITSANGHVLRLPDCTTEIAGMDLQNDQVRTVDVVFTGTSTASTIQMFASGAVNIVS